MPPKLTWRRVGLAERGVRRTVHGGQGRLRGCRWFEPGHLRVPRGRRPGRVLGDAGVDERGPGDGLVGDDPRRPACGRVDPDGRTGGAERGADRVGLVDAPIDGCERGEGCCRVHHAPTVRLIPAGS
jgi:hypothetical protein